MNRRSFLSHFGIGVAASAATAIVPAVTQPKESKLEDGSLRPKCMYCGTRMLVRYDGANYYGFCPLTTCKRYGVAMAYKTFENVPVHLNESPAVAERFIDSYNEQVPALIKKLEYEDKRRDERRRKLRT